MRQTLSQPSILLELPLVTCSENDLNDLRLCQTSPYPAEQTLAADQQVTATMVATAKSFVMRADEAEHMEQVVSSACLMSEVQM